MDDHEVIRKANRAASEFTETAEAFETVRAALVERWASSGAGEAAIREHLFCSIQALDAVQKALRNVIDNGLMAKHAAEMADLLKNPR